MRSRRLTISLALAGLAVVGVVSAAGSYLFATGTPGTVARAELARAYGRLPISFEPNRGQADRRARFVARGRGYMLSLTRDGASLSLAGRKPTAVRMDFEGGSERARLVPDDPLPGKVNYLVGSRRSRWHTNVPTYAKVRRREVYPGVDVLFYGRAGRLEYDFRLAPGADARQIVLRFGGAEPRLARNGDLILRAGGESVRQLRPVSYQRAPNGSRRGVRSRYELLGGGRVGLRVGRYDRGRPLVIDPVLLYSTYLGGGSDDDGRGIAVDGAGNAYVTGSARSTDFPRKNPVQAVYGGNVDDAFVTKFNPSGNSLVYSTYLGGSGGDRGEAIAVDGGGNAYVAGITSSANFPTANAEQVTIGGAVDAFVTKLNASGSAYVFSNFLGGTGSDQGHDIAVDGARNIYVTGSTSSTNFPTANADQATSGGGSDDAFLTKYNASGSAKLYSTYLGGSAHDGGVAVAVDGAGSAHVVGETTSTNFPTLNAQQAANGGMTDAFVTKYNATGSAKVYSTYLGGSGEEYGIAGAVDQAGELYAAGYTESANFPTQNPEQPLYGGGGDAFVTKFNPGGSAHRYSTYLGGSGVDAGRGIAVDAAGSAYVAGSTRSANFPVLSPFQPTNAGMDDAFLTRFNASGAAHVNSSYLGGADVDVAEAIALDGTGSAYLTGRTQSSNFPVKGAFQPNRDGLEEAFVSKIGESPAPATPAAPVDRTAPVISRLALSRTVFRAASRGGAIAQRRHRRRTRVRYALSEAARVTFRVQRAAKGRRVGGKCRRPTRANRNRRRCTRYILLRGSFTHVGRAGTNRFIFTGRLRGRKLRPARYRLRARAIDAAGNRSAFARKRFRIARR